MKELRTNKATECDVTIVHEDVDSMHKGLPQMHFD